MSPKKTRLSGRKRAQRITSTVSESHQKEPADSEVEESGDTLRDRPRYSFTDIYVNPEVFRSRRDKIGLWEEIKESRHKDSYCQLCSVEGAVYHPHFSTQYMREFATKYRTTSTYHCPVCKKEEPIHLPENQTRRLILTSSILYNVWEDPNLQVTDHFDMEAIVGGRVRDLTRALRHLYLDKPNRLEIIAMVAINNIGEGQAPEAIIEEMRDMKEMVKGHSLYYDIDPPSYVSFATCILPPKFCSFNVPLDVPDLSEWIPAPNFVNRAGRVEALNILIKELNTVDSIQYVGLHLLGMKFFKSGTKQHKFDSREGAKQIWREKEVFRKLHFTPEIKAKVISYAVNCFAQNSKEKVNPV